MKPGQMTSMHRHDFDYTFVVIQPSQLEVFGKDGNRLFDFWAEGTKAFKIKVNKFLKMSLYLSKEVIVSFIVTSLHCVWFIKSYKDFLAG